MNKTQETSNKREVAIGIDRAAFNNGVNAKYTVKITEDDIQPTITARGAGGVCDMKRSVRRLTTTECARLQNYPDNWCDIGDWVDSKGKTHKGDADAPKYKAYGNSIALPYWKWLCKRISAQYERDATLGSLFDGIGGFDICWAMVNGVENCRWSSEIEEFPIAVLKKHFGDEDEGIEGDYEEVMKGFRLRKVDYGNPTETTPAETHAGGGGDDTTYTLQIRSGKPGGGKGALIQSDKSATLSTLNKQTIFLPEQGNKKDE